MGPYQTVHSTALGVHMFTEDREQHTINYDGGKLLYRWIAWDSLTVHAELLSIYRVSPFIPDSMLLSLP